MLGGRRSDPRERGALLSAPAGTPGPHLPAGFRPDREQGAPLLTIVTATFNSAGTLGKTLASVAAQECQDLEHVIVDGGSNDATLDLVRAARHTVRWVSEPDEGIYDAFSKGLGLARGELIVFLNSDDHYTHPRVTQMVADMARARPDVDAFHADLDRIDAEGRTVEAWRFQPVADPRSPDYLANYVGMDNRRHLPHPTAFVRRRLYYRVGGFDRRYGIAADYDWFQRAYAHGATLAYIPTVAVRMRIDGISGDGALKAELETLHSSLRHADGPVGMARAAADFVQFHGKRYARARARGLARRLGLGS